MKTVGFIKQYDNENLSNELDSYFDNDIVNENRKNLIQYMQKGVLCVPLMGAVDNPFDEGDEEFIGYMSVYTDGEYIWPNYIISFLKKFPHFHLNEEFVNHVQSSKNEEFDVDEETRKTLENEYYKAGDWEKESE